jgi:uracil-DNA glycosylase family 4
MKDTVDDARQELIQLVTSLKEYMIRERKTGSSFSNFYLRGELASGDDVNDAQDTILDSTASFPSATLEDVRHELGNCLRCELGNMRKNLVFGEGNSQADLVFVGEAPGEQEDRQGRPFVGRAGQLLTRIIEAMGLTRNDVYICNILKCRPPGNRNPGADEIRACEPFLVKQLEVIQPKIICALGTFAARTLLKTDVPISVMRGKFHSYHGIKLMPTYHPAYLLRNPGAKKQVWEDVQRIMKEL